MREIKFRGKRVDTGEWVYGYYVKIYAPEKHLILVEPRITTDIYTDHCHEDYISSQYFIEVIPESVGEFTGLLDKNGKEIYEGDIYLYLQPIIKNRKQAYIEHRIVVEANIESWWKVNCAVSNNNCEVIGNIHENPELLK